MDRRDFLARTAGALGAAALAPLAACGGSRSIVEPARRSVTMWEFSWLVRRSGAEDEYADWDRVLDELAERGYDTIRLDAFPHLIAAGADGTRDERFTVLPQSPLFFWGNHSPVDVAPRAGLIEFLGKMRERGMRAGLSTWFNDDASHRAAMVRTPADHARIWLETLDHLADARLLDVVEWVDLVNEFPLPQWARGAFPLVFDDPSAGLLDVALPWSPAVRSRAQAYLDEGIGPLRDAYPELAYTVSFEGLLAGANARQLDTSSLDLAEVHVWLSNEPGFLLGSLQAFLLLEVPGSLALHVSNAPRSYFDERERWLAALAERMDGWAAWAAERGLPLVTSEAWGPINYSDVGSLDDDAEWEWVKDVCAEGVRMAVERDWSGVCTSNFCQPHFEGMWSDVDWHREQTALIRGR